MEWEREIESDFFIIYDNEILNQSKDKKKRILLFDIWWFMVACDKSQNKDNKPLNKH